MKKKIKIKINGKFNIIDDKTKLSALIKNLKVPLRKVAIELNKEIINKKKYILNNLGFFIILGITSITIFNSIVYYSLYYTQVISGILMISTIPVCIIFMSSILNIDNTNIFHI